MNKVHMKIKFQGDQEKARLFTYIASALDLDYPYGQNRRNPDEDLKCGECGGAVYKDPVLDADDLRALGRQISALQSMPGTLKVKVKKFTKNPKCGEVPETDEDAPKVETTDLSVYDEMFGDVCWQPGALN